MLKEVLKTYGLEEEQIWMYGKDLAKIDASFPKLKKGKLILMTSTNPTPYGEGKTTMSIGLVDALCRLGKKSIASLREPSLGPVFGKKGGATGGGESKVIPEEEINLHFTGDMHAITAANNLISAAIDNHLYWGNTLNIEPNSITFKRCIDLNDRSLREVELTISKKMKRTEHFQITAASELMAILCLSKDEDDLYKRIDQIYIGHDMNKKPIYVHDLKCTDAICILLKDAIKPNAVLTKEGNLAFIHGGPFANVAHGTSSYIGTNLALSLADIVVTEAGFGSDLGGFKFMDILSRLGLVPDLVILNVTIRSLRYHGEGNLEKGIENLDFHLKNMHTFSSNLLVVLNQFEDDSLEDIEYLKCYVEEKGCPFTVSTNFKEGSSGALTFANKVIESLTIPNQTSTLYELEEPLTEKIHKVLTYFGAKEILYTDLALEKLKSLDDIHYPICIAKTPLSISDDEKKLGYPKDYTVTVRDIHLCNGAKFIVIYLGNILTLPGLGKNANLYQMQFK